MWDRKIRRWWVSVTGAPAFVTSPFFNLPSFNLSSPTTCEPLVLSEAALHLGSNIFLPPSIFLPNLGLHGVTSVIYLQRLRDAVETVSLVHHKTGLSASMRLIFLSHPLSVLTSGPNDVSKRSSVVPLTGSRGERTLLKGRQKMMDRKIRRGWVSVTGAFNR